MSSKNFQCCDDRWTIMRKLLQWMPDLYSAIISGGGGGGVVDTFKSVNDINVPTAGTAVQGPNQACVRGVLLVAHSTNAGSVFVGGPGVTNSSGNQRGCELSTLGMPSQIIPCSNLNQLWFNADVNGDGVGVILL